MDNDMRIQSTLEVLRSNDESAELAEFIENATQGTIFHRPRFLSYHDAARFPAGEYAIAHLVVRHGGVIAGFLPGMVHRDGAVVRFSSPCGASFGGLVVRTASFAKCEQILDVCLRHLVDEEGVSEIAIAPPTSIYAGTAANDDLEYLYLAKGFVLADCELTLVTPIAPQADFPDAALEHRVRKCIRQAVEKGVVCAPTDDVDAVCRIIGKNRERFDRKPTHTADELKKLAALFPGRIVFFIARREGLPVAVASLFLCNRHVAYAFYIDQLSEHAECRAADLLVADMLRWLKEKGCAYLDFGPSTFGLEPHRSLIFFKEGFGARGIAKRFYRYRRPAPGAE